MVVSLPTRKPAPNAHPWWPTAGMFLVNGATYGVWVTQIPIIKERLGLDATIMGLMILLLGIGAVGAMLMSGYLIRRLGSAVLTRLGAAVFVTMLPLVALAPNLPLLAAALLVFGAAGGSMDVAMNAHGAEVECRLSRTYMSSFHGMWSVGGLVGAGLGGLLLAVASAPIQAIAAVAILAAVALASQRYLLARVEAPEDHVHASLRPDLVAVTLGGMTALAFAIEGAVLDWSSIYMRSELGSPAEIAGLGFAAFSATMAAGRFIGDRLRTRWGASAIIRGGTALAVVGLLAGPATGSTVGAVAGFALVGIGLSNIVPVLISAAGASRNGAAAIATVTTLGYGGLLIAPPFLGFVADATSFAVVFAVAAVLSLVVFLGAHFAWAAGNKGKSRTRRAAA